MKLTALFTLASLAASVYAQTISIGYPFKDTKISPNRSLTVQVNRPNSLTGSKEVAIVISLVQCPPQGHCPDPTQLLGNTLYVGPFNPEYPKTRTPQNVPQQNFTVTVPDSFKTNTKALLTVAHISLVGAGPYLLTEIKNVTVTVR